MEEKTGNQIIDMELMVLSGAVKIDKDVVNKMNEIRSAVHSIVSKAIINARKNGVSLEEQHTLIQNAFIAKDSACQFIIMKSLDKVIPPTEDTHPLHDSKNVFMKTINNVTEHSFPEDVKELLANIASECEKMWLLKTEKMEDSVPPPLSTEDVASNEALTEDQPGENGDEEEEDEDLTQKD